MTGTGGRSVGGASFILECADAWAAHVIEAIASGWHLEKVPTPEAPCPTLHVRSVSVRPSIPDGLPSFPVPAGTCHTGQRSCYIEVAGSLVVIDQPGAAAVQLFIDRDTPVDAPDLVRLVTYGVSATLRRAGRFELHSAALTSPSGRSVLIAGPSGSGKSTLSVHLASAGWSYMTDDVLVLDAAHGTVTAWPLRRDFAVTATTVAASPMLLERGVPADAADDDAKRLFSPQAVFARGAASCTPTTLLLPRLTGEPGSSLEPLAVGAAMTSLLRLSPWACYDRTTAPRHIAALSALATQARAVIVHAGRDLLDGRRAVALVDECLAV